MKKIIFISMIVLLAGCSRPVSIVTGSTYPPIDPETINVYSQADEPENFQVIAQIHATSNATMGRKAAGRRNMKKLKEEAGSLGATGIIIKDQEITHSWGDTFLNVNALAIRKE